MLDTGPLNHALISTDEVNFADFAILAEKFGHSADWLFPRDLPPRHAHDTITHDLDQLAYGNAEREAYVQCLCAQAHATVVAVLGYNLGDDQVARLRKHGILVFTHFDSAIIQALAQAFAARRAASPEESSEAA